MAEELNDHETDDPEDSDDATDSGEGEETISEASLDDMAGDDAADAVERSVEGTLAEGYRTPDIVTDGGNVVDTRTMGDVIAGGV